MRELLGLRREVDRAAITPLAGQQVSWWVTHEFITALVAQSNCGPLPSAGTPSWCILDDTDPRKLLALAIAGQHHALRVETAQIARAEASRDVAAAAEWTTIARGHRRRADAVASGAHIPRSATA